MNEQLIDLLVAVNQEREFEMQLLSKPDSIGFFTAIVNHINIRFLRTLEDNTAILFVVEPLKTTPKLLITIKLNKKVAEITNPTTV